MESQPQNPDFRINPENFHPCDNGCNKNLQATLSHRTLCNTYHFFFLFSTQTYVVSTQKNHTNERVLLSTHNLW